MPSNIESDAPNITTIADMRRFDGPLYVENVSAFPVTCNRWHGKEQINFTLAPAGQPGSVDELPKECLMEAGFRRLINRGDVRVSTDPEMLDRIEIDIQRQTDAVRSGVAQVYNSDGNLEPAPMTANPQINDLVAMKCLESGEQVFQTIAQVNAGVPPLSPRFKHLESQYICQPAFDEETKTLKNTWIKVGMTNPVQVGDVTGVETRNITQMG